MITYQHIEEYILFLTVEKGLSHTTIEAYQTDLKQYQAFIEAEGLTNIEDIRTDTIIKFLKLLTEEGKSTKTISRMQSTIKNFHQFLMAERVMTHNPTVKLTSIKQEKLIPEYLTVAEMNALLETPDRSVSGTRDKLRRHTALP